MHTPRQRDQTEGADCMDAYGAERADGCRRMGDCLSVGALRALDSMVLQNGFAPPRFVSESHKCIIKHSECEISNQLKGG